MTQNAPGKSFSLFARQRPTRRQVRRILLGVVPLTIIAVGAFLYVTGGRYVSTENAFVKARKVIIAAEVSGQIVDMRVRANQRVSEGEILFRIDDGPYRIALAQAEAQIASIRDEIDGLKAAWRQMQEEHELARSNLAFAEREYQRQSSLAASDIVSKARLDTADHNLDIARQQLKVMEQEIAQLRARLAGDPDIAVEEHPRFMAAKATLDRAALDLERTVVKAPFNGVVGPVPSTGQQVIGNSMFSTPIMSLVAETEIWIEANFKETDLTWVRPGQPVDIHVDTYPDRAWHGTVQSVSQTTGAEFSVIPPQNATGNWVKVVQRIPVRIAIEFNGDDPALRAGMSTSVKIDTGHSRTATWIWFGAGDDADLRAGQ